MQNEQPTASATKTLYEAYEREPDWKKITAAITILLGAVLMRSATPPEQRGAGSDIDWANSAPHAFLDGSTNEQSARILVPKNKEPTPMSTEILPENEQVTDYRQSR